MKKAFLMTAMQCHSCGFMATLNPPCIFPTEDSIMKAASMMHSQDKTRMCITPLFIIAYSNVLVSNQLTLQEPTDVRIQANNPEQHNGGQGSRIIVPPGVTGG